MTSSTSLYTTSNAANTSGGNYTTLYSGGAGVTVPQRAYGNANVVSLLAAGTDGGNTIAGIVATGNVRTTGNISATGNIYTAGWFVGNIQGDITGNIAAAGSNTQLQFNNNNSLGASGNLTFNNSTNVLSVTGNVTANYYSGNGSLLTGIISSYGNANVAAYLPTYTGNLASVTGRIGNNVSTALTLGTGNTGTGVPSTLLLGPAGDTYWVGTDLYLASRVGNTNIVVGAAGSSQDWVFDTTGNTTIPGSLLGNGVVSTTGNITGSNLITAGVVTATGNVQGGNLRTAGLVSAAGNITGDYYFGNGSQLSGLPETYNNANVVSLLAAFGSNVITTTGNITAGNFIGNGQYLTNIPAGNIVGSYGNANVADFLANGFGSNSISTTGNITVTRLQANGDIFGGGIASITGDVTGGNIFTAGVVSAVGDITSRGTMAANTIAPVFPGVGNSRDLTINAYGSGNINMNGPMITTYAFTTNGNITSQFGNLNAGSGGAGGVYSNDGFFGTSGPARVSVIGNITGGNIISNGNVNGSNSYLSGLLTVGNITSTGRIFAAGNIQVTGGGIFIGDGAGLYNIPAANVIGGYGNANVAANLAAFGSNPILTTGNITGGNLVATANLTSTQQTVIGTANVGTTGNIVVSGRNIATDMAWNPDGATGTAQYTGRVMVGTGWNGNNAVGLSSRLATMDMINRGNTGSTVRQLESETILNLTANVTNTGMRQQAIGGRIRVGGGSAANTTALGSAFGAPFSLASGQFNLDIGNASPYFLGNTSVGHATMNGGVITLSVGSSIGNAYGFVASGVAAGGTANITNYIGVVSSLSSGFTVTGNMFCFYNGNASTLGTHSVLTANTARAATNYYFLRNDDDVAQVKLGSLRSYNEFQYATATSGTVNIDKTNAQVQYLAPTANVTIGDFQNFVTNANDGTNNDPQTDTVTLIIQQGATPYTITMPTGNAAIKYANGISTIGTGANEVILVSISAVRNIAANTAVYLTTISPGFS